MTKKNVYIFGAGLYGLILAILLNKNKNQVTIIDQADDILASFKPIKIDKYLINNGFHGIDYPRGKGLISFLKNFIKIKLKKNSVEKRIVIEKFLIDYLDKFNEYPEKLKNIYIKKNLKNFKNQKFNHFFSKHFIKNIFINTKRYSSNPEVAKNFFLPYFLPADTKHITKDEGAIFRNSNRNFKKKSFFYTPKNGIFFSMKYNFYKILKKHKVKILLNSQIQIGKDHKIKIIDKKNNLIFLPTQSKIYFCMSSIFFLKIKGTHLLKDLASNKREFYNVLIKIKKGDLMKDFTEILVLNKKIYYVNRITKNNFIKDPLFDYYQIEILIEKILNTATVKKNIQKELGKILKCKINFVGIKLSRVTYHPNNVWLNKAKQVVKNYLKKLPYKISTRLNFYPVNMNKAWLWANEDIRNN